MPESRHFVFSMICCVVLTLFAALTGAADGWEGIKRLIIMDINVAMFLFIAWLFAPID